ncbi:MAG: DUF1559 domain-containing protein [Candidatus Hydrogenedentes bacterium]|nr:DUF1559 domain-containing protein [Candidatus Hydrogenedentota bacterium]
MTERDSHSERFELLRGYLLGTLSEEQHAHVEAMLAADPAWQEDLVRERDALALLDALPEAEAPPGLATRTLATIREERDLELSQRRRSQAFWVQASVMLAVALIVAAILMPALSRSREASRRASSQNNLKQLGIVMKMYANESPGEAFPPLTPYEGLWMFDIERVYPKYLSDLSVLVNPSRPDARELQERLNELVAQDPVDWREVTRIAAMSYAYPGWVVKNDEEATALDSTLKKLARADLGDSIETEAGILYRPREGIERFFITDINNPAGSASAQSEIPIFFETPVDTRDGINVGYMDGHVSYVKSNVEFPATDTARKIFRAPEAMQPGPASR